MSCRLKQATNTVRKGVSQYNAKIKTHTASVPEITFEQAADPNSLIYSCLSIAGIQVRLMLGYGYSCDSCELTHGERRREEKSVGRGPRDGSPETDRFSVVCRPMCYCVSSFLTPITAPGIPLGTVIVTTFPDKGVTVNNKPVLPPPPPPPSV